ncbi:SERTA domain-containing protein 3 [Chanos chanos]|uniref:SERTA domain-containing protein 3 n=1 Tax=Chanos chanos TaxID=29144 RepID=A0A6J2ULU8_CHACN|nr:cell division cycle-associated protein 4-like [Chanos chanos]
MVVRGLKRKLHVGDENAGPVWESQLQSVLDISLDKFHRDQALVEPSLLRSVLINNTLRQVQSEVRSQVESAAADFSPQRSLAGPGVQQVSPQLSSLRGSTHTRYKAPLYPHPSENTQPGENWMAWSSDDEFSLSTAISSILKDLDASIEGGFEPPMSRRTPLGAIENVADDAWSRSGSMGVWSADGEQETCRYFEATASGSLEFMRSNYLQDVTLDNLFLDIDTSVFEPPRLGAQALSVSTTDKMMKHLYSWPSPSSPSHSQMARDLNELEQSGNILVRS